MPSDARVGNPAHPAKTEPAAGRRRPARAERPAFQRSALLLGRVLRYRGQGARTPASANCRRQGGPTGPAANVQPSL